MATGRNLWPGRSVGLSALALSEYHLLLGRYVDAHGQTEKAIRILRENSLAGSALMIF